nr:MAG TPA: hypothetical protein [Bacteriophage sp.]
MKPLNLKETALKEEMKDRCLAKGQYIDENAKAKFKMLCHLEDFEVQYWKLHEENKILRENAENNDKVVDKVNWENMLLKKENQELKSQLNTIIKYIKSIDYDYLDESNQHNVVEYLDSILNRIGDDK